MIYSPFSFRGLGAAEYFIKIVFKRLIHHIVHIGQGTAGKRVWRQTHGKCPDIWAHYQEDGLRW